MSDDFISVSEYKKIAEQKAKEAEKYIPEQNQDDIAKLREKVRYSLSNGQPSLDLGGYCYSPKIESLKVIVQELKSKGFTEAKYHIRHMGDYYIVWDLAWHERKQELSIQELEKWV